MDTSTASSMVITVPILYPGDDYSFPEAPPLSVGMEPNSSSLIVTYSGSHSIEIYQNLTQIFRYRSTLDEPGIGTRSLSFQIFTPSDNPGETIGSNVAMTSIQILPLNDNPPEFTRDSYSGRVVENAPPGTPIGVRVSAEDSDVSGGTNITFVTFNPLFYVDPISGAVSTRGSLDAEGAQIQELIVTASDNDGADSLTSSVLVYVNVTDVNDNAPVFNQTLYSPSAREDLPIGAVILTVFATDEDVSEDNSIVTYAMSETNLPGSGEDPIIPTDLSSVQDTPFAVDANGNIVVTRGLDFDVGEVVYDFTVLAVDSGIPPLTASSLVRIRLADANDNPPQFTSSIFSFRIEESRAFPSEIVSFMATDADSGLNAQIRYTLQGASIFSVDSSTGLLSLNGSLDFETTREYRFTIVATDFGSPPQSSQETVSISVENENDNPPMFLEISYSFLVRENMPFAGEVTANDPDLDSVTYREISGFVHGIQLDILSGEISNGVGFDFETQRSYFLVVEASDGLFSTSVNVSITVEDVNDNPPIFSQELYSVDIAESLSIGSSVVQVSADDRDESSNAVIEYSLQPQEAFGINTTTGVIYVSGPLDFDTDPTFYLLNVTVRNPFPPFFENLAVVRIGLLGVNDVAPILTLDQSNVTFIENSDPIFVASNLFVMDVDSPLVQCSVELTKAPCASPGITACLETVSVDEELASQLGLSVQNVDGPSQQTLTISGNGSDFSYQSLLQTLQYGNLASEPVPGIRPIRVLCQDERFDSNVLGISVSVQLQNEFCPTISASVYAFNFTEGVSTSLQIGSLAVFFFTDQDSQPHDTLQSLQITLNNRPDSPSESISINNSAGLEVVSEDATAGSGLGMFSAQTLTLQSPGASEPIAVFERALQSLVYTNNEQEPSAASRQISILPVDQGRSCTSVDLTVDIIPVNDNPPQLVLSLNNTLRYEEESGQLLFAAEAGLMVTDLDDNNLFPMQSATIFLDGILDGQDSEILQYSPSLLPEGVIPSTSQAGKKNLKKQWKRTHLGSVTLSFV